MSYIFALNKKSKGFTLIEIIVSLAIIGILFSIGIISYGNWKYKATVTQTKSDLLQLSSAFEDYRNNNKAFPTDVSVLSNFKASNGITITGGSLNGFYYCINAASVADGSLIYHITSDSKEVLSGACPASSWKSVSMGRNNTCAIDSNDRVYCWGQGGSNQLGNGTTNSSNVPVPVSQGSMPSLSVKQIATGQYHSCAIASDDQVYCWGGGSFNALGDGSGTNNSVPGLISQGALTTMKIKQISINLLETCVLAFDNNVYCWGDGMLGIASSNIPIAIAQGARTSMQAKQVVVNQSSICVIGIDDIVYCLGQNYSGQLGDSSYTNSSTFVAVLQGDMPSQKAKKLAGGTYNEHNCAIGFDDRAYCWGSNYSGQAGNGQKNSLTVPKAVSAGSMSNRSIKSISVNKSATCAVNFDNLAFCWGGNYRGNLGDGTFIDKSIPNSVYSESRQMKFNEIVAGGDSGNACAVSISGDIYCWGYDNTYGSIGLGYNDYIDTPSLVDQGAMAFQSVKKISLGYSHSCAIDSNDSVYCWGVNTYGQLGIGNSNVSLSYKPASIAKGLMPINSAKQISSSMYSSCLIGSDNKAYCWGYNTYGQLGDTSTTSSQKPVAVAQGSMPSNFVKQITVGENHACAMASDDTVYCWGRGNSGQLGNGTVTQSNVPTAVSQGDRPSMFVKSISAYGDSTCAIASNDNVYCWGAGGYGQLGNGSTANSLVPVAVLQGTRPSMIVKSLETGFGHACVIASNDNMYCWGYNYNGQLGNGLTSNSTTPTTVLQGSMQTKSVSKIALGRWNSCAISADGKLFCWGIGQSGQLSSSSNKYSQTSPVTIFNGSLSNVSVIQASIGGTHICALITNGNVYCWGENNYGQLGVSKNSVFSRNTPQFVKHP